MRKSGIIINGLLPNSTTVLAIMDELYQAFKNLLRQSTHDHWSRKIKKNTMQISRQKVEIARKLAHGESVAEDERSKTKSVVTLNPMDLGPILFGELTKDGFAHPNSPIAQGFTKEKIIEAHRKVSQCFIFGPA